MALFAAIDCGTNTFHLIVVEFTKGSPWKTVFRKRVFVYLAEDGIGHISVNAKKRAVDAFAIFSEKLKELNVSNIRAHGTAGLRTAKNAIELIREIQNKFAIDIEIIDGEKEAALIQKGVMHYAPANPLPYLIMDIGGGSVEFILWQDKVLWSKSFPIGVSIIYNTFHQADPLSKATIQSVFEWLNLQLKDLKTVLKEAGPCTLIGAGGTFDVIENIIGKRDTLNQFTTANMEDFLKLSNSIQLLDQQQRAEFPGIPPFRSKLAIEAFLLVEFTLSCGEFDKMVIVEGDIKDGILLEMIQSSI
jgi:exopolyphosphatase/guanosine-5'-triphosphate,3'-diphosphate pyrophosphatase